MRPSSLPPGIQLLSIGEDVYVANSAVIKRPQLVRIGNHVAIDDFFYLTTPATLGDYIHIGPMVTVIGGPATLFTMGHFSTVAAGCRIICAGDRHLGAGLVSPVIPDEYRDDVDFAPVTLENFASLGTNVVVMPGVTIAEGSVVGANSLVTKSTEPWMIYVGSPAKPVRARPSERMKAYAAALGYPGL